MTTPYAVFGITSMHTGAGKRPPPTNPTPDLPRPGPVEPLDEARLAPAGLPELAEPATELVRGGHHPKIAE